MFLIHVSLDGVVLGKPALHARQSCSSSAVLLLTQYRMSGTCDRCRLGWHMVEIVRPQPAYTEPGLAVASARAAEDRSKVRPAEATTSACASSDTLARHERADVVWAAPSSCIRLLWPCKSPADRLLDWYCIAPIGEPLPGSGLWCTGPPPNCRITPL